VKTIKQIADDWGVTKDKIKYRLRGIPSEYLVKNDGVTYVTDEGIQELWGMMNSEKKPISQHLTGVKTQMNTQVDTQTEKIIGILQKELEMKNNQISDLTAAVTDLTTSLTIAQQTAAAAQALHAGTIQHLAGSKPGFFSRFFKRTNDAVDGTNR